MLRTRRIPPVVLVAGLSLVAAVPVAWADPVDPHLVPFRGTISGSYTAQVIPPNVIITASGDEGHATHLGRFEMTGRVTVGLVRGPVPNCPIPGTTEVFTATLTAANGDMLMLEGTGTGCQTSPTTVEVIDHVSVSDGTGRFEDASGLITVRTAVDQSTSTQVVQLDGAISTRDFSS